MKSSRPYLVNYDHVRDAVIRCVPSHPNFDVLTHDIIRRWEELHLDDGDARAAHLKATSDRLTDAFTKIDELCATIDELTKQRAAKEQDFNHRIDSLVERNAQLRDALNEARNIDPDKISIDDLIKAYSHVIITKVDSLSEMQFSNEGHHTKRLKQLQNVLDVSRQPGNHDNEYHRGLTNGLILAHAIMHDQEPQYIESPPTHYVNVRSAFRGGKVGPECVVVKEAGFFAEQGGLTAKWGKSWRPVVADSIEHAREVGAKLEWGGTTASTSAPAEVVKKPKGYSPLSNDLAEALKNWMGEMAFTSGDRCPDGTPQMGKHETEQVYRAAKAWLKARDGKY
jgi:hypothetical protein